MKKLTHQQKERISTIVLSVICLVLVVFVGFLVYEKNFKTDTDPIPSATPHPSLPDLDEGSHQGEVENGTVEEGNGNVETPVPTSPVVVTTPTPTPVAPPTATPSVSFQNEQEVISYFETQSRMIDTYQAQADNPSILDTIKNGFVTVVDFLFYGKEIGGYTFSELTTTAKLKIISLGLTIDHKIDSYFPNYKETIKAGYENIKAKLVKLYLDFTSSLCETVGDATCSQAKEDFQNMKDSFGFTFDLLKEAGGNLVDAIRTWYEIFSDKR